MPPYRVDQPQALVHPAATGGTNRGLTLEASYPQVAYFAATSTTSHIKQDSKVYLSDFFLVPRVIPASIEAHCRTPCLAPYGQHRHHTMSWPLHGHAKERKEKKRKTAETLDPSPSISLHPKQAYISVQPRLIPVWARRIIQRLHLLVRKPSYRSARRKTRENTPISPCVCVCAP